MTNDTWPNSCDRTVPEALRYLAQHERPSGDEQRFNTAHLIQLAEEIERAVEAAAQPGRSNLARLVEEKDRELVSLRAELAIQRSLTETARRRASELGSAPKGSFDPGLRERLIDVLADVIGGDAYDCIREWSAWSVRTMGEDDFLSIAQDHDRLNGILDAVLEALPAGAVPEASGDDVPPTWLLEEVVKNSNLERGIKANAFDNLARCIREPGLCRKQGLTDLAGVLSWHERHLEQVAEATGCQPDAPEGWRGSGRDRLWRMIGTDAGPTEKLDLPPIEGDPTNGQLADACLSYDHGYGMMTAEQRDRLHIQCREWWRCIARAVARKET